MSLGATMTRVEAETAMRLAIGRLFRLASRPTQPGDTAQYFQCRDVVMEAGEVLGLGADTYQSDYVREYGKGTVWDSTRREV